MADDTRVCSPSGAPGGWCAREAADCASRCALEVEYAAEASDASFFSFQASLTVVNNQPRASLRAWQATWAFAEGEGVARDAAFATDVAVLVSPGGPGGQPARLVNALGEGGAVPPAGGRKQFAFPGVASGATPRSVARVTLNGATCAAIHHGHHDPFSEPEPGAAPSPPPSHASLAPCPPDAVSFRRFCCGDALVEAPTDQASESEKKSSESDGVFAFRGAPSIETVVSAALLVVAGALVLAVLARAARALGHRVRPTPRGAETPRDAESDAETARKTTAFLPGQTASAPAADCDGVVVRSSAAPHERRPLRAGSVTSQSVSATTPVWVPRVGVGPAARGTASLAQPACAERRRGDSSDSSSDAESAESAESADGADALVVVPVSEIELGDVLGRGAYGVVRRGVWKRKAPSAVRESGVADEDDDAAADDDAETRVWTSTRVAVKTLRATRLGARPSRGALRAFKREVAVLSRLRHPCVVRLLGACLAPPDLCIVEELVEGGSLHAYLHGPGARRGDAGDSSSDAFETLETRPATDPSVAVALDVCFDVARAMAYLAARGVTHRDLKSQNVLLTFPDRGVSGVSGETKRRRLRAKVADFGIAKSRDGGGANGVETFLCTNGTTGVVTGGGAAGTPAWMAPELFRDTPVADEASDAYSFGVVLWECLTGKTPWGWLRDPIQIVFAVAVEGKRLPFPLSGREDARRLLRAKTKVEDGFSFAKKKSDEEALRALLERCWAEAPRDRPGFEAIGEVLRGLRASVARGTEARAEP